MGFLFAELSDGCRDTRLEKQEMVQLLYRLNTGWGRTEKEATCLPFTVYVCRPGATDTSVSEAGSQAEWIGWLLDSCTSSLLSWCPWGSLGGGGPHCHPSRQCSLLPASLPMIRSPAPHSRPASTPKHLLLPPLCDHAESLPAVPSNHCSTCCPLCSFSLFRTSQPLGKVLPCKLPTPLPALVSSV